MTAAMARLISVAGLGAMLASTAPISGANAQTDTRDMQDVETEMPPPGGTTRIVILNPGDPYMPAVQVLDESLREAVRAEAGQPVEFYSESIDLFRFPRERIQAPMLDLLRAKYAEVDVDVVVAVTTATLDFAESYGDLIWKDAPIVFHSVPLSTIGRRPSGPRTVGLPVDHRLERLVDFALRVRPRTRRIVVVAGTNEFDREMTALARLALESRTFGLRVEYLDALPLAATREALAALGSDAVVLFLSMGRDGNGEPQLSRDVISELSAVSGAPLFGIFDTYLGDGIVGGPMTEFAVQGQKAGELVKRIVEGEPAEKLGAQPALEPSCIVDWVELRRWRIDESLLPDSCDIRFENLPPWQRYRWQITLATLVIAGQAALISALVVARYRRRRAELDAARLGTELRHAGRVATIGEITANITHEICQPLAAILANTTAAKSILDKVKAPSSELDELGEILTDIEVAGENANSIISQLRVLLGRRELQSGSLDLNAVVEQALTVISAEARRREIPIVTQLEHALPRVLGDRVHLLQVLLNLVINAMDAMAETPAALQRVTVRTGLTSDGAVELSVSDRGHGIPPEDLPKLFDSFFTTKANGMGLGLSISRTIVEALGGAIRVDANSAGGATFRVTLAVAPD